MTGCLHSDSPILPPSPADQQEHATTHHQAGNQKGISLCRMHPSMPHTACSLPSIVTAKTRGPRDFCLSCTSSQSPSESCIINGRAAIQYTHDATLTCCVCHQAALAPSCSPIPAAVSSRSCASFVSVRSRARTCAHPPCGPPRHSEPTSDVEGAILC